MSRLFFGWEDWACELWAKHPAQATEWDEALPLRGLAQRYKLDPGGRILWHAQAPTPIGTGRALVWLDYNAGIQLDFQPLWARLRESHHCVLHISVVPAQLDGSVFQRLLWSSLLHPVRRHRSLRANCLPGAYSGLQKRLSGKHVPSDHGWAAESLVLRRLRWVVPNQQKLFRPPRNQLFARSALKRVFPAEKSIKQFSGRIDGRAERSLPQSLQSIREVFQQTPKVLPKVDRVPECGSKAQVTSESRQLQTIKRQRK